MPTTIHFGWSAMRSRPLSVAPSSRLIAPAMLAGRQTRLAQLATVLRSSVIVHLPDPFFYGRYKVPSQHRIIFLQTETLPTDTPSHTLGSSACHWTERLAGWRNV